MDKKIVMVFFFGLSIMKQISSEELDIKKQALVLHLRYNKVLDRRNLEDARKLVVDYRNLLSDNTTYKHQKLRTHCVRHVDVLIRTFGSVINN